MSTEHLWNDADSKNRSTQTKSIATAINLSWTDLALNSGLRGETPENNHHRPIVVGRDCIAITSFDRDISLHGA